MASPGGAPAGPSRCWTQPAPSSQRPAGPTTSRSRRRTGNGWRRTAGHTPPRPSAGTRGTSSTVPPLPPSTARRHATARTDRWLRRRDDTMTTPILAYYRGGDGYALDRAVEAVARRIEQDSGAAPDRWR